MQATWLKAQLIQGHGVASGRSENSPYPAGTIAMQRPLFHDLGLDLSDCYAGTLNLSFAPLEVQLRDPDHTFAQLCWTDRHLLISFQDFSCLTLFRINGGVSLNPSC